jgi:uncharacterized membrane protein
MTGAAFLLMQHEIVKLNGRDSVLAQAVGADLKGWSSLIIYLVALAVVAWAPWVSCALYAVVAAIWFIPDRRIETRLAT